MDNELAEIEGFMSMPCIGAAKPLHQNHIQRQMKLAAIARPSPIHRV